MNDLRDRLDALADSEDFAPLHAATAITQGRRSLRRRRAGAVLGGAAATVAAALVVGTLVQQARQPDVEFGDPAGREPARGDVPTDVAYDDLVVSRTGGDYVSISGFGWPLADGPSTSGPDGSVVLPEIDRTDAEVMCLPMLETAAPEVPASAWRHSEAGVDDFPSRATLPTTMEASYGGREYSASCALPGDYVADRRPDLGQVPSEDDDDAIREQCSYLGHVDLTGWDVETADGVDGLTVASLALPDGPTATCVLTADPSGRVVQLSTAGSTGAYDPLVYHASRDGVAVAGTFPGAEIVTLQIGMRTTKVYVAGPAFAATTRQSTAGGREVRVTVYDGREVELASWSTTTTGGGTGSLLPSECFYTLETGGDGC